MKLVEKNRDYSLVAGWRNERTQLTVTFILASSVSLASLLHVRLLLCLSPKRCAIWILYCQQTSSRRLWSILCTSLGLLLGRRCRSNLIIETVLCKLLLGSGIMCFWHGFLNRSEIPEAMSLGTLDSILWKYIVQFKQDFVLFLSPGQVFPGTLAAEACGAGYRF